VATYHVSYNFSMCVPPTPEEIRDALDAPPLSQDVSFNCD
jgi:hypothetical protein